MEIFVFSTTKRLKMYYHAEVKLFNSVMFPLPSCLFLSTHKYRMKFTQLLYWLLGLNGTHDCTDGLQRSKAATDSTDCINQWIFCRDKQPLLPCFVWFLYRSLSGCLSQPQLLFIIPLSHYKRLSVFVSQLDYACLYLFFIHPCFLYSQSLLHRLFHFTYCKVHF